MELMSLVLSIVAIIAVAVCLRAITSMQRKLEQFSGEIHQKTEQVSQLIETVRALEMRIADLAKGQAAVPKLATAPVAAPVAATPSKRAEEIAPELLVVMAAAVTVFLGKQVRIRSAKMLQSPYEIVNPWAQQGRVFVQASHNLWQR